MLSLRARFTVLGVIALVLLAGCRPSKSNSEITSTLHQEGSTMTSSKNQTNSTTISNQNQTGLIPMDHPDLHFMGRFATYADDEHAYVLFGYPGTAVKFKFVGTSVSASIMVIYENYINVVIDGGEPKRLKLTDENSTYILAEGLENKEHIVEIYKATEFFWGDITFYGFDLGKNGYIIDYENTKNRKFEFIGDSITCGYGNLGVNDVDKFLPSTQNNLETYGPMTASNLNAEYSIVAFSGKGLYKNNDGSTSPGSATMPDLYKLNMPVGYFQDVPEQYQWDFAKYVPDAVFVNLGTNDFASGSCDTSVFKAKYMEFIHFIRQKYPQAHIFCIIGPMISTPNDAIQSAAAEIAKADPRVYFMAFDPINIAEDGLGVHTHPTVKTNRKMAKQLTEFVKLKTGW